MQLLRELNYSLTEESISINGLENSSAKVFPKGTLLTALYNATACKLDILGNESTTNQAFCGHFENDLIVTKYLFYYLKMSRAQIVSYSLIQAQPNISQSFLK